MSDLQIAPPPERSPLTSVLLAVAVLAIVAVCVFYFVPRDTARVTVTSVKTFAPTTTFAAPSKGGRGLNVISGATASKENDLYVVVTVHVQNQFRFPISVDGASASFVAADGSTPDGNIVPRHDATRLEEIFPSLAPLLPKPIGFGDEIAPHSAIDGQFVLQFPGLDDAAWRTKKSASLSVEMHNQPAQTVPLP